MLILNSSRYKREGTEARNNIYYYCPVNAFKLF